MRIGPLQPSNSSIFDADMWDWPVGSVFSMPLSTSLMQNVTCKKKAAELKTKVTKGNPSHLKADYLGSN
jgi:hypothetical protein